MAYLDAATDRLALRGKRDFEVRVEAARMGAIFARNQKAYARWRTKLDHAAGRSRGLTGAHLEAAVMGLAQTNPEYVVHG